MRTYVIPVCTCLCVCVCNSVYLFYAYTFLIFVHEHTGASRTRLFVFPKFWTASSWRRSRSTKGRSRYTIDRFKYRQCSTMRHIYISLFLSLILHRSPSRAWFSSILSSIDEIFSIDFLDFPHIPLVSLFFSILHFSLSLSFSFCPYAQTLFRFVSYASIFYIYVYICIYKNTKNNLQNDIISILHASFIFFCHTFCYFFL